MGVGGTGLFWFGLCEVLQAEPRVSQMLGKHFATVLHPQPRKKGGFGRISTLISVYALSVCAKHPVSCVAVSDSHGWVRIQS